jgi:hypothetical protein
MKKFRVLQAILVLFSAFAVTSCGEEPELPPLGPNGTNATDMKVSMGSELFDAEETTANVAGGAITITGTNAEGDIVTMTIDETALTLSAPPEVIFPYENVGMTYMGADGQEYTNVNPATGATMGTVTFTSVDITNRTVTGNFAFIGYDPDNATAAPMAFYSGTFSNVPYTGDALPAPVPVVVAPVVEFLKASIDGGEVVSFGMISGVPTSGNITITGATATMPATGLSLIVSDAIAVGTHNFATAPTEGPYASYSDGTSTYESTAGTISIVTNDGETIKGTFTVTVKDSNDVIKELTSGEFNVEIDN